MSDSEFATLRILHFSAQNILSCIVPKVSEQLLAWQFPTTINIHIFYNQNH